MSRVHSLSFILSLSITTLLPALPVSLAAAPEEISLSNSFVAETRPTGTIVGILTATDSDEEAQHTFRLVSGYGAEGNPFFTIEGTTLKTATVFDREAQPNYLIRIRATSSNGTFAERAFEIGITAVGDLDFAFDAGPIDWSVHTVARQNDGKWIIGGTFTTIQNTSRRRVARLNPDGSLDTSFMDGLAGANNDVFAIAVQEDGKILVAGSFTSMNGRWRYRIARLHPNGSLDLSFLRDFEGPNRAVRSIALQKDGKILIGGDFDTVNGEPRNGIARFTADGTLDESFVPSLSYLNWDTWSVASIAVQADGKILVAGSSQKTSGEAGPSLVRLWAHGGAERTFDISNRIESVVLQDNGGILIGGSFTSVLGQPRNRIARLDWNGALDPTFGDNLEGVGGGTAPRVNSIAIQPSGKILIGGSFSSVHGEPRNNFARLHQDGSLDNTLGDGMTGASGPVYAIAPAGRTILIAGWFRTVNDVTRRSLALLEGGDSLLLTEARVPENRQIGTTIARFSVFDPDLGDTHVFTLVNGRGDDGNAAFSIEGDQLRTAALIDREEREDYTIRVRATGLGGIFLERVFILDITSAPNGFAPGEVDLTFRATPDSEVYTATHLPDGKYIITGLFRRVQGIHSENIARLNADGSFDQSFEYPFHGIIPRGVNAVALGAENKIFIGGGFSTVHGESHSRIARLNSDGSLDTAFGHDVGKIDRTVRAIALQPDGKVLIGGEFTNVHGTLRRRIARLKTNGALDNSFGAELAGADDTVNVISVQSDGKILIGGRFTTVNGVPRNHFARLHSDGTLDDTFALGLTGADAHVTAILVQPDGRIVLTGYFSTVHGHARHTVARLNLDGSLDTSFMPAVDGNGANSVAMQKDGKILLGGWFTTAEGRRTGVIRLHSDGSLDDTFDTETSQNLSGVSTLVLQDDGRIFIAGWFSSVNGISRPRVARLYGGTAPPSDILLLNNAIRDHQPIGTEVSAFSAMDPSHPETHVYSLVPGDGHDGNDFFTIDGDALKTAAVFDADEKDAYSIRVRAANSRGLWVKQNFTITVEPDPFLAWAEALPEGQRGETEDPGGFGIFNLFRYAFGMNALHPEREKLPRIGEETIAEEGESGTYLTLTYTRRTDDNTLVFIAEFSDDLLTWLPFAGSEETADDGNGNRETVTLIDSQPINEITNRFLRLRVER